MMAILVLAMAWQRNLFAVVVMAGIYSFLMATVLVALDAVDVAMTEASVGAGVSTVLLLGALHLTKGEEAKAAGRWGLPLLASAAVGAILVYGTLGLPGFSDASAPIQRMWSATWPSPWKKPEFRTSSRPCSRATVATIRWGRPRSSSRRAPG
jgi:multicomponent Na+:H+ antiporter subunit B